MAGRIYFPNFEAAIAVEDVLLEDWIFLPSGVINTLDPLQLPYNKNLETGPEIFVWFAYDRDLFTSESCCILRKPCVMFVWFTKPD